MLKQYVFTELGAYGEFVMIIIANSIEEAVTLKGIPKALGSTVADFSESVRELGWSEKPQLITSAPKEYDEPFILFSGGGDYG